MGRDFLLFFVHLRDAMVKDEMKGNQFVSFGWGTNKHKHVLGFYKCYHLFTHRSNILFYKRHLVSTSEKYHSHFIVYLFIQLWSNQTMQVLSKSISSANSEQFAVASVTGSWLRWDAGIEWTNWATRESLQRRINKFRTHTQSNNMCSESKHRFHKRITTFSTFNLA